MVDRDCCDPFALAFSPLPRGPNYPTCRNLWPTFRRNGLPSPSVAVPSAPRAATGFLAIRRRPSWRDRKIPAFIFPLNAQPAKA